MRIRMIPTSGMCRYDPYGIFSSPRALFMFRAFGHHRSSILDGGLPAWQAHGGPVEAGEPADIPQASYPVPTMDADIIRSTPPIPTVRAASLTRSFLTQATSKS